MNTPTLGLVSLGHSPRPDLIQAMQKALPHATILLQGALDGIAKEHLPKYKAHAQSRYALMALAYDTVVDIDMDALIPNIEQAAQNLTQQGAQHVVLMCSAAFAPFQNERHIIRPISIIQNYTTILASHKRIGIINPIAKQIPAAATYWQDRGFTVFSACASPFEPEAVRREARKLLQKHVDVIILDCMSFTEETHAHIQDCIHIPVLLPMKLMQHFMAAL